jgi:hypothetical protein
MLARVRGALDKTNDERMGMSGNVSTIVADYGLNLQSVVAV